MPRKDTIMKTFNIFWGETLIGSISDQNPEKAKATAYNLAQLYCILYAGAPMQIVEVEVEENE